jgi:hypothetical protein
MPHPLSARGMATPSNESESKEIKSKDSSTPRSLTSDENTTQTQKSWRQLDLKSYFFVRVLCRQ